MSPRLSSRERIMDAAEQVVLEEGASHMTMDAVAAKAGVSKGGLIYHFPSQRELLQAMLQRFIDLVDARMAQGRAKLSDDPARDIKAYVHVWFSLDSRHRRSASALLAAITREPELLQTVREKHRAVLADIVKAASNPEQAMVLSMATEGMWMSELLNISPLSQSERQCMRRALLRIVDEWHRPAAVKPSRQRCKGKKE